LTVEPHRLFNGHETTETDTILQFPARDGLKSRFLSITDFKS